MSIEPYQPRIVDTDSWVHVLEAVARLSVQIAGTDMVPEHIRDSPSAIAAVILYGREVGLPPMTALRTVYLHRGRVGMLAEAMRGLTLAAGHSIEYRESTSARCVVAGRRAGSDYWHTITWDADTVRQSGVNTGPDSTWRKYPRAMLKARATAELCRDLFPDVLGGFAAVEEINPDNEPEPTSEPARPRRQRVARKDADVVRVLPSAASPDEPRTTPASTAMPALPGEADAITPPSASAATSPPTTHPPASVAPTWPDDLPAGPEWATDAQRRAMHAAFDRVGITRNERERRLAVTTAVVGRPIGSSNDLTADDAAMLLDALGAAANTDDPSATLDGLMAVYGMTRDEPLPFDRPEA